MIGIQEVYASIVYNARNNSGAGEKLATVPKMQPDDVEPAVAAVKKTFIVSQLGKNCWPTNEVSLIDYYHNISSIRPL